MTAACPARCQTDLPAGPLRRLRQPPSGGSESLGQHTGHGSQAGTNVTEGRPRRMREPLPHNHRTTRDGPGEEARGPRNFRGPENDPRAEEQVEIDKRIADRLERALPHQTPMTADTILLGVGGAKILLPLKPALVTVTVALDGITLGPEPALMVGQIFFRAR